MVELLSDYTLQTVMIGAALIGVLSGVLGSFAVLRGQGLLGDTLSHAALPGVCLGFLIYGGRSLEGVMAGALFTGVIAALLVVFLHQRTALKMDVALAAILGLGFALGVVLLTYIQRESGSAQAGLDSFLFGQAAAVLRRDLYPMAIVTVLSLLMVVLLWKPFKLMSFDPAFAAVSGLPVRLLEVLLTAMIALAVVVGLQMVGVVLMTAMVIAPGAAARQWARNLSRMVILAAIFGATAGVVGGVVSAFAPGLSTGPVIVLMATALALISLLIAPHRGLLPQWYRRRHRLQHTSTDRILLTVYELAREHGDWRYRVEQGAIDAYHGMVTEPLLQALAERGHLQSVRHMPDEGAHWQLTEKGQAHAEVCAQRRMRDWRIGRAELG